ncbi:MAG TPA: alpha/beta hydrolase [Chitinophagaceae bacterium]|nr:alpha/beta hydrolase [Chitinophagaceae bacterium]
MNFGQKLAVNYIRAKLNILSMVSKEKAAKKTFELFCTPFKKPKKKKPPIFEKAEKLSINVEDLNIHGHRWNHPQEKKFLIVHGFESTSYNFDRYVVPMTKKGYEVLAFDAPAHGKSDGKQITLPLYVATIKKINEEFGPITAFLSHSFGGLAVSHFLESTPHDQETRLALIAPATETTTAIDSFFEFLHLNGSLRKEFDEYVMKKGSFPPEHYSIRRAMNGIKAQVLWVHDQDDEMTPLSDALKVHADQHANVQFLITEGLGHRKIYRENQVVKAILDFF